MGGFARASRLRACSRLEDVKQDAGLLARVAGLLAAVADQIPLARAEVQEPDLRSRVDTKSGNNAHHQTKSGIDRGLHKQLTLRWLYIHAECFQQLLPVCPRSRAHSWPLQPGTQSGMGDHVECWLPPGGASTALTQSLTQSPGMPRTPGWLNRARRCQEAPPQMTTPCRCTVAR